jgi:hypothetical protein
MENVVLLFLKLEMIFLLKHLKQPEVVTEMLVVPVVFLQVLLIPLMLIKEFLLIISLFLLDIMFGLLVMKIITFFMLSYLKLE